MEWDGMEWAQTVCDMGWDEIVHGGVEICCEMVGHGTWMDWVE